MPENVKLPSVIIENAPKILIKHIAAVHSNAPLTIIQRKIANVFLENALSDIAKDKVHRILVKDVMRLLGWTDASHATQTLKESIQALSSIQIEWNILDKDKKNEWVTSPLLGSTSFKHGYICYSYTFHLRLLFAQPNIYAKLDLDVQKTFKNKYALILWEFICGDLSAHQKDRIATDWIDYAKILKLVDLMGSFYEKRYSLFRDRILKPAFDEINRNADIVVQFDEKKKGTTLTHLRFFGERKVISSDIAAIVCFDPFVQDLLKIGLNDRNIEKITCQYTVEEIAKAIDFYHGYPKKKDIGNPVAFFHKALEQGWVVPVHEEQSTNALQTSDIERQIDALDEDVACRNLRTAIVKAVGVNAYKWFFADVKLSIVNDRLVIACSSMFIQDRIEADYGSSLRCILHNLSMPLSLQYVLKNA